MKPLDFDEVREFANEHIAIFHQEKAQSLESLNLRRLLRNKNPYLFKAKNIRQPHELVESLLSAHLSASEEEIFGQFLERLAIFVASKTSDGVKSDRPGVDLEMTKRDVKYIVQIKSGTKWGNSSQHRRLVQELKTAVDDLNRDYPEVRAVLGICYGKTRTTIWREFILKVVGQNFWYFLSDNPNLYTDIIEPIGYQAKQHNEEFQERFIKVSIGLNRKMLIDFTTDDNEINWEN